MRLLLVSLMLVLPACTHMPVAERLSVRTVEVPVIKVVACPEPGALGVAPAWSPPVISGTWKHVAAALAQWGAAWRADANGARAAVSACAAGG